MLSSKTDFCTMHRSAVFSMWLGCSGSYLICSVEHMIPYAFVFFCFFVFFFLFKIYLFLFNVYGCLPVCTSVHRVCGCSKTEDVGSQGTRFTEGY